MQYLRKLSQGVQPILIKVFIVSVTVTKCAHSHPVTYVHPALEYARTVWDTYTQQHIDHIEAIQSQAARFVMQQYRRTSSASAMIEDLKWTSLQDRRKTARLAMLYIIHNIIATDGIKNKLQPPSGKSDCSSLDHRHICAQGLHTAVIQNNFCFVFALLTLRKVTK